MAGNTHDIIEHDLWRPTIFEQHNTIFRYAGATRAFRGEHDGHDTALKMLSVLLAGKHAPILLPEQKHTTNVAVITQEFFRYPRDMQQAFLQQTDGLITSVREVGLTIFAADCAPIAMFDPLKRTFGLFHSGWRGTVGKIAQVGVEALTKMSGSHPHDIIVSIGPTVSPQTYSVDEKVHEKFVTAFSQEQCSNIFIPQQERGKYLLNIPQAIKYSLIDVGVLEKHIEISELTTSDTSDLFPSARKAGGVEHIKNTVYVGTLL